WDWALAGSKCDFSGLSGHSRRSFVDFNFNMNREFICGPGIYVGESAHSGADVNSLWAESLRSLKKNRGAMMSWGCLIVIIIVAIAAPWLAPYDPTFIFSGQYSLPPIWFEGGQSEFLLGTDDLGRDLLSRLVYGARVSVGVGFLVVILSLSVGSIF